jgi:hypothetical protein
MVLEVKKTLTDRELTTYKVASPIDGWKIEEMAKALSFLNGFSLPSVAAISVPLTFNAVSVTSGNLFISYQKSPGAKVLLFEMEPPVGYSAAALKTAYMDITLPTSASWIGTSQFDSTVLSESREYSYVNTSSVIRPTIRAYADITNCTTSSILTITASFSSSINILSTSNGHGLSRLNIMEVPRFYIATSSTDVGIEKNWFQRGRLVEDESSAAPYGTYGTHRLIFDLDSARYKTRSQQNLCFIDDPNQNYSLVKSYGASEGSFVYGTNTYNVDTTDRFFYMRVKNIYGSSQTTAPYKIRVIYKTLDGSGNYKVKFNYRAVGAVSFTTLDINCTASTSIIYTDATVDLPTTGTNQELEWYVTAVVDSDPADVLYVYNIFIAENFT